MTCRTSRHSISQYITVYYSISQYITVYYSIPQYTTVYHSVLQYTTVYDSIPQCTTVYHSILHWMSTTSGKLYLWAECRLINEARALQRVKLHVKHVFLKQHLCQNDTSRPRPLETLIQPLGGREEHGPGRSTTAILMSG